MTSFDTPNRPKKYIRQKPNRVIASTPMGNHGTRKIISHKSKVEINQFIEIESLEAQARSRLSVEPGISSATFAPQFIRRTKEAKE